MPTVSRRSVLAAAVGVGTTGVAALLATAHPLAAGASPLTTSAVTAAAESPAPARSHYSALVGETFTASSESASYDLVLYEIADLEPTLVADDENRFNLLFSAPNDFISALVTLAHPAAPSQLLFIAAFGPDAEGTTVQALINRTA